MELVLSKKDNQILWLIKILLGLCLLTPLLASSAFLFPYTAPKAFVFRILVEIAALFYFYLCLKYPDFRPKKTALNLAVLVFLIVWFLASFFGVDFYLSFWGNLERMLGFWGLVHFVLFFGMLVSVFQTDDGCRVLLKISVAASSLVALLAIIQRVASLGDLMPLVSRVYGTIGNPAFFASYLLFNIFLAGYLLMSSANYYSSTTSRGAGLRSGNNNTVLPERSRVAGESKALIIVYSLLFLLNLVALLFTGTRGAFLGLLVGLVVLLILFSFFYPQRNLRRYFTAVLVLFLILFGLLFIFRQSTLVQKNETLQRLFSISLKDTTSQNRLIIWRQSWRAWQEKPLLGWGLENFEVAANKYFDPRLNPYEAWYDRAHNFIFDYGVAGGWLGLISYLSLFSVAFWYLVKITLFVIPAKAGIHPAFAGRLRVGMAEKEKGSFSFSAIFISLLVAYLVQNFFVFDSFVSYLMLFFTLAMIGNMSLRAPLTAGRSNPVDGEMNAGLPRRFAPRNDGLNSYKKFFLAIVILAIIFSLYFLNFKPLQAGYLANRALSFYPSDYYQGNNWLQKSLALETFASPEITYQATIDYLSKISNYYPGLVENEDFYKLISVELLKNIGNSPQQARYYVSLAWLDLYFYDEPSKINSAIDLAQKVKIIAPGKKDAYLILMAAYSLSGEKEKAWQVIEETKKINEAMGEEIENYWRNLQ